MQRKFWKQFSDVITDPELDAETACEIAGDILRAAERYAEKTQRPWDDWIVAAMQAAHKAACAALTG